MKNSGDMSAIQLIGMAAFFCVAVAFVFWLKIMKQRVIEEAEEEKEVGIKEYYENMYSKNKKPEMSRPRNRNREIELLILPRDEFFTSEQLISYAQKVFLLLAETMCTGNLKPIMNLVSLDYYTLLKRKVQAEKSAEAMGLLEGSICETYLTGYKVSKEYEYVTVYIFAQKLNFLYQEQDAEADKETTDKYIKKYYYMKFARSLGSQTGKKDSFETLVCPNCGAPLEDGNIDICSYCGSTMYHDSCNWIVEDVGEVDHYYKDEGIQA